MLRVAGVTQTVWDACSASSAAPSGSISLPLTMLAPVDEGWESRQRRKSLRRPSAVEAAASMALGVGVPWTGLGVPGEGADAVLSVITGVRADAEAGGPSGGASVGLGLDPQGFVVRSVSPAGGHPTRVRQRGPRTLADLYSSAYWHALLWQHDAVRCGSVATPASVTPR